MPKIKPPEIEDDELEAYMAEARENALRKKAQQIAEREIGLLAEEAPGKAIKGPTKKLPKDHVITLDLAEHSDRLTIDSTIYLQGRTYTVDKHTHDTMREMIHRGWEHQREIDGKDMNAYRKQGNVQMNMNNMHTLINTRDSILESARNGNG